MRSPYYLYAGQHQKKSKYIRVRKWNDKIYFSAENLPEVSPVVMNYKMRHNKNRPARDSLVWPLARPLFPLLIFVVAEKRKNMVWTYEAA